MMSHDMEQAGTEAVQEIASSILKAAGAAMARHGDDPNGGAIIAAGFALAIEQIGKHIDPRIMDTIRKLLREPT